MRQIAQAAEPTAPSSEVPLRDVSFLKEATVRRQLNQGLQDMFRMPNERTHVVREGHQGHIGVQRLRTMGLSSNPQWARPAGISKCLCVLHGHVGQRSHGG